MTALGARPHSITPFKGSPWAYFAVGLVAYAINDAIAFNIVSTQPMPHHSHPFFIGARFSYLLVVFHLIQGYMILPAILASYVWLDGAPRILFRRLTEEKVLVRTQLPEADPGEYREYRWNKPLWVLLYFVGGVLALIAAGNQWLNPPGWNPASHRYAHYLAPTTGFLLIFMLFIMLAMVVEAVFVMRKVFDERKFRLHLRPFHPDRVCGLGALKHYAQSIVYIIGALGAYLLIDVLQGFETGGLSTDAALYVYIAIYVVLVPLCFTATLWFAHGAMVRERDRLLLSLIPASVGRPALSGTGTEPEAPARHLDDLKVRRELFDVVMSFPVWPFDSGNVLKVASVSLSPLLTAVGGELLKSLLPHK